MRRNIQAQIDRMNQQIDRLAEHQLYEEAIVSATSLLEFVRRRIGERSTLFAKSLNKLGMLYDKTGEYAKAESLFIEAHGIVRAALPEQHPYVATSLNNLAALYYNMGEYAKSEPLYQRVLAIRRATLPEQHPDVAAILNNLATLYDGMGEYAKAKPLHQRALAIRRATLGERHPDTGQSLSSLGVLYDKMGEYAKAEPLYQQALAIRQRVLGDRHPAVAVTLNNLATLYYEMGEYVKAEPLYLQALTIRRAAVGERHFDVAESLNNLGMLYYKMGEYAKVEPLYQQAVAIQRATLAWENPYIAATLNNLAMLYYETGEYAKAEPMLVQALAIRRATLGERHPNVAESLTSLATLYQEMGEYAEAEPLFIQALAIQRTALSDRHPDVARSLNSIGILHKVMGEYSKAEFLFVQALAIRRAAFGEQHLDVAESLSSLGILYGNMGEYAKAEPLYQQALAIQRAAFGERHPDTAHFLSNLACVCVALGRETEAFALLWQTLNIEDQTISQIFSAGSEHRRMAYLSTIQVNFGVFLSLVLELFPTGQQQVQAAMDVVLRRKGITAEALATQRDALLGGCYPALASKLEQLRALRTQIVQRTLTGPVAESIEAYQQRLSEWNVQKDQLEADLARHIPEMNLIQQLQRVNRQVIASTLPNDGLLIEFVRSRLVDFHAVPARGEPLEKAAHYIAFVLSARNPNRVQMIDLGEAERIDGLIATFRMPLSSQQTRDLLPCEAVPDEADIDQAGKELRMMVFDPLMPYLHESRQLFLAPDGDLSRLPFEILPADDGQRLIDHYHISYLSVGRDLLRFTAVSSRQAQAPVVMADPSFDLATSDIEASAEISAPGGPRSSDSVTRSLTFERLPGTRLEGQQVAQALSVQPMLDEQAVVSSLKALRSPRILHLATHGFFLPDQPPDPNKEFFSLASQPLTVMGNEAVTALDRLTWLRDQHLENSLLRSGLALAGANTWNRGEALPLEAEDGLLTAEDVSGLDLLDTELVVLSACETGLGVVQIGEGVFGLRRTFMLAGAKTLIMSLWKVPDQQTQELMADFYRRLLTGQPRAEALRQAQLALKEKYPHPYFWGAFICQGDPGVVSW